MGNEHALDALEALQGAVRDSHQWIEATVGEIDYMLRTRELVKAAMRHIAEVDNWLQAV